MRRKKFTIDNSTFGEHYIPEEDDKYIGDYLVQEWTFGDREEVVQQASDQELDGDTGKYTVRMRSKDYRVLQILYCLKKAPFKVTEKNILGLPNSIADKILKIIGDVNEVMEEDEEKK